MSSFGIYAIGIVLVILGLAYGAYLAGAPTTWIAVGVLVLAGIGVMSAVAKTRRRDPS